MKEWILTLLAFAPFDNGFANSCRTCNVVSPEIEVTKPPADVDLQTFAIRQLPPSNDAGIIWRAAWAPTRPDVGFPLQELHATSLLDSFTSVNCVTWPCNVELPSLPEHQPRLPNPSPKLPLPRDGFPNTPLTEEMGFRVVCIRSPCPGDIYEVPMPTPPHPEVAGMPNESGSKSSPGGNARVVCFRSPCVVYDENGIFQGAVDPFI